MASMASRTKRSRAREAVEWCALGVAVAFVFFALPRRDGDPLFDLTAIGWGIELALSLAFAVLVAGRFGLLGALWRRYRSRPSVAAPSRPVAYSREPIPAGLRFAVLNRDGFRCAYCGRGKADGVLLHIDHLVPVARGGRSELDNLVTACASCNLGKSAQDLVGPDVS